jgi:hypothetical protein
MPEEPVEQLNSLAFYHSTINGNTSFEELVINKGNLTATLTINGSNSVSGGGSLTMISGLLTLPEGGSFTSKCGCRVNHSIQLPDSTSPVGALSTANYTVN